MEEETENKLRTFYEKHELYIVDEDKNYVMIGSKHSNLCFKIVKEVFDELFVRDINEENCLHFFIDERPISSHPPRVLKTGWSYDPKREIKQQVKAKVEQMVGVRDIDKKVPVFMKIIYEMPKVNTRNKKEAEDLESGKMKHLNRPDIDNLQKFTFDVLKGVVYADDSQICRLELRKVYAPKPGSRITVRYEFPE